MWLPRKPVGAKEFQTIEMKKQCNEALLNYAVLMFSLPRFCVVRSLPTVLKQNGMIEGDVSGGETFPEEIQNKRLR